MLRGRVLRAHVLGRLGPHLAARRCTTVAPPPAAHQLGQDVAAVIGDRGPEGYTGRDVMIGCQAVDDEGAAWWGLLDGSVG